MEQHADLQDALANIGLGRVAYLRVLDYDDVIALVGPDAEIEPHEIAFCLVDADGSPNCLRGSVGAVLIAAQERGLHVVPVH